MQLRNKEVRIENINLCNLKCVICPHDKMTRMRAALPNVEFYDLVKQAKALGADTISIFGFGEPLMDSGIVKKVRFCTEQGLNTFITTNAMMLDLEMTHALIDAGLTHIRFSVHGIDKMSYQKAQKGASWDIAMKHIYNYTRFKGGSKISVTSIPLNGTGVDEIEKYWNAWDIDWLEIWKPHGWAGAKGFRRPTEERVICNRPESGPLQIQADGKVIPCCFITNAEVVLGDIYRDSLEDILKSKKYEEFRNRHKRQDLTGLPCKECDQTFKYNQGNSPLLYSSRDKQKHLNCTSSTKFKLEG